MTIITTMRTIIISIMSLCLASCGVATIPLRLLQLTKPPIDIDTRRRDIEGTTELALSDLATTELRAVMDNNGHALSEDSQQFKKVSALLEQITNRIRSPRLDVLRGAKLYIIPADEPIATSYYPNIILLSTSVINPASPCGTEDDAALTGVLTHELLHLVDGHTQYKAINRAYANSLIGDFIGYQALHMLTWPLPFVPRFRIQREPLYDLEFAEWYFESVADLFAMKMLSALGFNPASYVHYVQKLYDNSAVGYCAYADSAIARANRLGRLTAYISGASYKESNNNVRYIYYNRGKFADIYQFNANNTYNRETTNRVLYWEYATLHDKQWCSVFPCFNTDLTGADPQVIDHFTKDILKRFKQTSLPIRINGFESYIFDAQPELLDHLVHTGELR